jgi:hypothetical protein
MRPEVAEDQARIKSALLAHGAAISDTIQDPKIESLEQEQAEEQFDARLKRGDVTLEALFERMQQLEADRVSDRSRIGELEADLEKQRELSEQMQEVQGLDRHWMEFATAAFTEDEQFRKDLKRIREEQDGKAVIVVHHHSDPVHNIPIKGSVNFIPFRVPRGIPTLVDHTVLEALYFMRRVTVEKYLEGDKKKNRVVYERRANFNIMPAGAVARANAWQV